MDVMVIKQILSLVVVFVVIAMVPSVIGVDYTNNSSVCSLLNQETTFVETPQIQSAYAILTLYVHDGSMSSRKNEDGDIIV